MSVRDRLLLLAGVVVLAVPPTALGQAAFSPGKASTETGKTTTESPGEQPSRQDDRDAIDGGKKWLELVDGGKLGDAWDVSAQILKSSVTRSEWVSGLSDLRKPFGKLVSRTPAKFARAHSLPGAPEGDYAIVEYDSVFAAGKKKATEQITWMMESDGVFRVVGYFIR